MPESNNRPNILIVMANPFLGEFFTNFDYRAAGVDAPEIWHLKTHHFALFSNDNLPQRTVAVFNLSEHNKECRFTPADFSLDDSAEFYVTDVWTLETETFENEYRFTLEAHASRLLAINLENGRQQLLDANIKLLSTTEQNGHLQPEIGVEIHIRE